MSLAIFFFFLRINFGGRRDSCESRLPPIKTIYFPTAPFGSCVIWDIMMRFLLRLVVFLFRVHVPDVGTVLNTVDDIVNRFEGRTHGMIDVVIPMLAVSAHAV